MEKRNQNEGVSNGLVALVLCNPKPIIAVAYKTVSVHFEHNQFRQ